MNTDIKPLIFIPSARDLPEFEEYTKKLNYDKLWIKYHPQEEAYVVGRNWFLEHSEYTHLIILPDDLLLEQSQLETLLQHSDMVMSGWCIHGKSPQDRKGLDSNVSFSLPSIFTPPMLTVYESYDFIPINEIKNYIRAHWVAATIKFSGFAPTIIPREIVQQVPFRASHGCCVDTCFSQDLLIHKINQFVNFRVQTKEIEATSPELIQVGKKEKEIRYEHESV